MKYATLVSAIIVGLMLQAVGLDPLEGWEFWGASGAAFLLAGVSYYAGMRDKERIEKELGDRKSRHG